MSRHARVTSLALISTILCSPPDRSPPPVPPPAAKAKWTVMVYMSGDNNLESYIVKDLELELAALGSTPNVQVTALADRGPGYDKSRGDWQTTKLYHPTQGMVADAASAVADWGERNMGSAQTLTEFVTWSKTNYPADRYALYFWGHGWGWHPGWTMEDASSGAEMRSTRTRSSRSSRSSASSTSSAMTPATWPRSRSCRCGTAARRPSSAHRSSSTWTGSSTTPSSRSSTQTRT